MAQIDENYLQERLIKRGSPIEILYHGDSRRPKIGYFDSLDTEKGEPVLCFTDNANEVYEPLYLIKKVVRLVRDQCVDNQ